jgi:hypothetical protein
MLDVTHMDDNGKHTKIIRNCKINGEYHISTSHRVVSLDKLTFDIVINIIQAVKYKDIISDEECQVCYSEKINIKYNSCSHEL